MDILDIVCCPSCQGNIFKEENKLFCKNCETQYKEKNGILILISKELEKELRKEK